MLRGCVIVAEVIVVCRLGQSLVRQGVLLPDLENGLHACNVDGGLAVEPALRIQEDRVGVCRDLCAGARQMLLKNRQCLRLVRRVIQPGHRGNVSFNVADQLVTMAWRPVPPHRSDDALVVAQNGESGAEIVKTVRRSEKCEGRDG